MFKVCNYKEGESASEVVEATDLPNWKLSTGEAVTRETAVTSQLCEVTTDSSGVQLTPSIPQKDAFVRLEMQLCTSRIGHNAINGVTTPLSSEGSGLFPHLCRIAHCWGDFSETDMVLL